MKANTTKKETEVVYESRADAAMALMKFRKEKEAMVRELKRKYGVKEVYTYGQGGTGNDWVEATEYYKKNGAGAVKLNYLTGSTDEAQLIFEAATKA